jgi:putative glutamine amidotransferase
MKPRIGITCNVANKNSDFYAKLHYRNIDVISKAGGLPIILPSTGEECEEYLAILDGIYFSGGIDINPMFFGEDPICGVESTNIERDRFEIELYKKAVRIDLPMLGVCRGMQVINIAAGGTIYQDLSAQLPNSICHNQDGSPLSDYFHKILIEENSKLYNIHKNKEIYTNTFHHQAVKDVAPGFKITAKTKDGVIEAIESINNRYILAVQWHPEHMYYAHDEHFEIFKSFINECKKPMNTK